MELRLERQFVRNAGIFFTCYQLSRLGWKVMPIEKKSKWLDIVAYPPNASASVSVHINCFMKRAAVSLGGSLEKISGDYWIIVNNIGADAPRTFVMLPNEVKEYAKRNENRGKISFWLEYPDYEKDQFCEAWHRLEKQ